MQAHVTRCAQCAYQTFMILHIALNCSLSLLLLWWRLKSFCVRRNCCGRATKLWRTRTREPRWTIWAARSGLDIGRAAVRPMAAMRAHLLLLLCVAIANGQRRPPQVRMADIYSFNPWFVDAGGRRLWTRQSVVRTSPSSPRWPAWPEQGRRRVPLSKGGDPCLQLWPGRWGIETLLNVNAPTIK